MGNQTQKNAALDRQINHKTMRKIIGAIAILLAPVTYWLSNVDYSINSISATYWTNSGDLFVGALIVVGFFLAAYNGTGGRDWEFYLSKIAAVFAICIALFPTKGSCFFKTDASNNVCPSFTPPSWISWITDLLGTKPFVIHNLTAILLFVCLLFLLWFFSNRAAKKEHPLRARIYRILALAMIFGILLIGAYGYFASWDDTVLWVEVWGLTLFGIGWLIAGSYAETDNTPS